MSNIVMPILVLNLSGEMLYILQQRLEAQAVRPEKARTVLEDVIRTTFSMAFVDELFRPQALYKTDSMLQLFYKLAHSSIMRLNQNSMDKLYDLMTMGVKHQVMMCRVPQDMLLVTLNHLETIKLMTNTPELIAIVTSTITRCLNMYTPLTDGHWMRLKATALRFFHGRKVKVSLFLTGGKQLDDGEFVLEPPSRLAVGVSCPGCIKTVQYGEYASRNYFEYFYPVERMTVTESTSILDLNFKEGLNTYCKNTSLDRSGPMPTSSTEFASCVQASEIMGAIGGPHDPDGTRGAAAGASPAKEFCGGGSSAAKAEISLLSDLLGGAGSRGAKTDDHSFTLNLFPAPDNDGGQVKGLPQGSDDIIHFNIDGAADAKTMESWSNELDLKGFDDEMDMGFKACAKDDGEGGFEEMDDLLDLMDSAK